LIAEVGDELAATIEYNTALFDAPRIVRMLAHFRTLLEGIVANPDEQISKLPLLTPREKSLLIGEWAGEIYDSPPAPGIPSQFETQVEKSPESVAVILDNQSVTYNQINRGANQIAHYLRQNGLQKGQRVGVLLQRSIEAITALLGILKAGGVYLPLDPSYPQDRTRYILQDGEKTPHGQVSMVISQESLAHRLPEMPAQVILLDSHRAAIDGASDQNPGVTLDGSDPAYVIYTSGSTGRPKGVLIPHGAIANHCRDMIQFYELSPADRVLQFAALNFDASLEQILPTLIVGAQMILRGPDIWSPQELLAKIQAHKITIINLPPAYWHQVAAAWANLTPPSEETSLRLVIIGGDVLQAESLQFWSKTPFKSVRLLNAYGPTETTITATTYEVSAVLDQALNWRRIPIGRPTPNRRVYILDKYGNPVPVGVHGELHIGGGGLSLGYLGHPELTAKKFIPDPFASIPQAKMYKTGDLTTFRADSNIEFIGRVDDQVKVRGFRVEPGEVEAILNEHPEIHEASVVTRQDKNGDKQLIAYVVPTGSSKPSQGDLVRYLQARLPHYMIPAAFITLTALPLTPGGKVDRQALPQPDNLRPELDSTYSAPRDPIETDLCKMWAEVLGVDKVGIYDNFFELGGHSLMATQVTARVREMFNVDVPLRELFEAPTIASLAEMITHRLIEREDEAGLVEALAELEEMSDEDVQRMLADESFS